jgi:hypothetical protein
VTLATVAEKHRSSLRSRTSGCVAWTLTLALAIVASTAAAIGWVSRPAALDQRARSIRIVDVRPLHISDVALRDVASHTFRVRVATTGWALLPYHPTASRRDNRRAAGYWRLYLDGFSLGDVFGTTPVAPVYLTPGTHWLAAELRNLDHTGLKPSVWSEPVVLYVPRRVRCWQAGLRRLAMTVIPRFTCRHPRT